LFRHKTIAYLTQRKTELLLAMNDEADEFEVERIIDKRERADGVVEYLIKWLGYQDDENTWEPQGNCPLETITEFEENAKQGMRMEVDANSESQPTGQLKPLRVNLNARRRR
jgi:hypothetical protein